LSHAKVTFSGDLKMSFVVVQTFWSDGLLGPRDKLTDRLTYSYVGACPAGMPVKMGSY